MSQFVTAIGGEMELDLLALTHTEESAITWPFSNYQTVMSGRTAIKMILKTLEGSGTFLLPSYLCASILQPFKECSVQVAFYRINSDLSLDLDDLMYQVETLRPVGLLFINYFGFSVKTIEAEVLRKIGKRCLIIEDCVQGSLIEINEPTSEHVGHFVITSFRKYLPVPDGGLIVNRIGSSLPKLHPANGNFVRYRLLGKFLRHEYLHRDSGYLQLEDMYLRLFVTAENELDEDIPLEAMSQVSDKLLSMIDLADITIRRRQNFSFLLKAFKDDPQILSIGSPVLPELQFGVSPLAFPIHVNTGRRDALRQELITNRVFCSVHWYLPAEIQKDRFIGSCQLSQNILSLPIDQRYNEHDMEMLLDRLSKAWRNVI